MKKAWNFLKLFFYLIKVGRHPENTTAILRIGETLLDLNLTEQATKKLRADPEFQHMWKNKTALKPIDLLSLQKLPENTVGRVYADHMISRNLNPNFFNEIKRNREVTYAIMRIRETHDLWHILTGFDTTVADELGLQAFTAAQTNFPLAPLLIGSGLFKSALTNPERSSIILTKMSLGWQMGINVKPVFAIDWDSHWMTPLESLRAEYNVQALKLI